MEETARDFTEWYRAEHPRVLGSLLALCGDPEVAAEVTADAFARALASWRRVAPMASPAGWTYQVALNGLRRRHRRSGHERRLLAQMAVGVESHVEEHFDESSDAEVWDAVRALPEKQRVSIVLRYVADLPEADIATAMRVTRGTVASNLADARRSLARYLGDEPESISGGAPVVGLGETKTGSPIVEVKR